MRFSHLEWENCEATLVNGRQIRVRDVLHETAEELDFRDRVRGARRVRLQRRARDPTPYPR